MAANELYAFLDIKDYVEGESEDSDYARCIALQNVSWGATNHSSFDKGTGSTVNKGHIHEISCTKLTDRASLNLMRRCVNGQSMRDGKLILLKLSGDKKIPYFQVDLKNVVVTSWQIAASGSGQLPAESFSLHFVIAQAHYKPQGNDGDPHGNVDFGWDLQQGCEA
jgi:type VI secretion system secreted protein Hcp